MTIPQLEPNFTRSPTVTFEYPYASPTTTVTLPAPAFGDLERYSQQRITQESRGGTLIMYRDPDWAEDDELAMTFTNLLQEERDAVEDMLDAHLGKEYKYTDHFGQIWKVIITNPETQFVQDSGGDCPRFTVNLTLNAELVSWP